MRTLHCSPPCQCLRAMGGEHEDGVPVRHTLHARVEAQTREEAKVLLQEDVEAHWGAGSVLGLRGGGDPNEDREVLLWTIGTRCQLSRWEVAIAEYVRYGLYEQGLTPPGGLVWRMSIEKHLALVAANNLRRAVEMAGGRYPSMPAQLNEDVKNLRDVHEHWDEYLQPFEHLPPVGKFGPAGKKFVGKYPDQRPFTLTGWDSATGPRLGPGVTLEVLTNYLDEVQAAVLATNPSLARFVPPIAESPWVGPDYANDRWWPKAAG